MGEWVIPPYGRDMFTRLLQYVSELPHPPVIFEVGSTRKKGNIAGDGYSTPLFAYIANEYGGEFYSIDIDPEATLVSTEILIEYKMLTDKVHLITSDVIGYIKDSWKPLGRRIDILYLDGWEWIDPDKEASAFSHFIVLRLLEPLLNPTAIVSIDDVSSDGGVVTGKGEIVIPYLLGKGYEIEWGGCACSLSRSKQ
jgi:predicted O-methyltransferase YrrM